MAFIQRTPYKFIIGLYSNGLSREGFRRTGAKCSKIICSDGVTVNYLYDWFNHSNFITDKFIVKGRPVQLAS